MGHLMSGVTGGIPCHRESSIGYMDRLDYVSMLSNEVAYCEAVEGVVCSIRWEATHVLAWHLDAS